MGRRWDAVTNCRRVLDLKGKFLEEGSVELGDAYRDVAEAYVDVLGFEKALPLCLKALVIMEKRFGNDSIEVAKVRRVLMVVYVGLGRHEEALEQNELARIVYERLELDAELSLVEIDGAVPYLERAVEKLKNCFRPLHFGLEFADKHLGRLILKLTNTNQQ